MKFHRVKKYVIRFVGNVRFKLSFDFNLVFYRQYATSFILCKFLKILQTNFIIFMN
jgi:hypothetical protein